MWMKIGFKAGTWISKTVSKRGHRVRIGLIEEDTADPQSKWDGAP